MLRKKVKGRDARSSKAQAVRCIGVEGHRGGKKESKEHAQGGNCQPCDGKKITGKGRLKENGRKPLTAMVTWSKRREIL